MKEKFGYDKVAITNGGVEGDEYACKFARQWGYNVKGVEQDKAKIVIPSKAFWGRTIEASGGSDDKGRYTNFGPYSGGFTIVEYNNVEALEECFKADPNIVMYLFEPIQGEAGIKVPDEGYLRKVRDLCDKYNVIMCTDEIQTGLGRTGDVLCHHHEEGVRPDFVVLGKALGGGLMPVSCVLLDDKFITDLTPGKFGNTFGGGPIASTIAHAATKVIFDEGLAEKAKTLGSKFLGELSRIDHPLVKETRGRGLFCAIEMDGGQYGDMLSNELIKEGILARPTQKNTIRLAPPLIIDESVLMEGVEAIDRCLKRF